MSSRKRLDSTVAALQRRYGEGALRQGLSARAIPPHISTSFAPLDALTGCQGIPLSNITLLSGRMTSGKLTLAYKTVAEAQGKSGKHKAALLDMNGSSDPDYLARCGVKLEQLVLVRPAADTAIMQLLIDLLATGELRLLLIDSLPDLLAHPHGGRQVQQMADQVVHQLRTRQCALIVLDEFAPSWRRWLRPEYYSALTQQAALHIALKKERWLTRESRITGYEAEASLVHSRWAVRGGAARIAITFNGTVRAQATW
ncbi:MAG: hypothetical protein R2932_48615 [Caldilineaceae bacterium]